MKNLYEEFRSFFEIYIKKNKLKEILTTDPASNFDYHEYIKAGKNETYFKFIRNVKDLHFEEILIKEKKSSFLNEFFEISETEINQIISFQNFINKFFNENNKRLNINSMIIVEFDEYENLTIKDNYSYFIRFNKTEFIFHDKVFSYSDFEFFPAEEVLNHLKSIFLNKLNKFGINTNQLSFKQLKSIYEQKPSEFLNNINKIKNFKFKSKDDINEILKFSNGNFFNNTYSFSKYDEYKHIKSIFKTILDEKNYSYFSQSLDLIHFYQKKITGNYDDLIYFSFRENKFPAPLFCYSLFFQEDIILNIGVNITDLNCSLLSYSFNNLVPIGYLISSFDHNYIREGTNLIYSNNMENFYLALLNKIKHLVKLKLNKETITFNDIKMLQILNF